MLMYDRNHHNIVIILQLKIKLKKKRKSKNNNKLKLITGGQEKLESQTQDKNLHRIQVTVLQKLVHLLDANFKKL